MTQKKHKSPAEAPEAGNDSPVTAAEVTPTPVEMPESLEMTAPTLGAMLMTAVNEVAMTGHAEAAHQLSQVEIAAGVLRQYLPGAVGVSPEPLKGRLAELLALLS